MKNNLEDLLRDYQISKPTKNDILETIHHSKEMLKKAPIQKYEPHLYRQYILLLRYHFPKVLFLQTVLCCICCVYFFHSSMTQKATYTFLLLFSLVTFIASSFEIIRSRIFAMWEIEKVCAISFKKILIFKILTLNLTTLLMMALLSICLAMTQGQNFFLLLAYGFLPFILLNAVCLQFDQYLDSPQSLLTIYVCTTIFFITIQSNLFTIILELFTHYISLITISILLYSIVVYYYKLHLEARN